jgi:SAM-dependent methyltransferase
MGDDIIQNQWDDAAETWCDFVRGGKDFYREHMNGPALVSVMGDVAGKTVLDVGCGEGYFARCFAERGAVVTGIDVSVALLALAVAEESDNPRGITYLHADAADLSGLASNSHDLAFCFMALMDIRDYEGTVAEVSRVLRVNGRFVVVIPHPCFTVPRRSRGNASRYPSAWETRVRDTLSDYVNAFTTHGLHVTRIEEPRPLAEGVTIHPPLVKHDRVPQAIVIETTKSSREKME